MCISRGQREGSRRKSSSDASVLACFRPGARGTNPESLPGAGGTPRMLTNAATATMTRTEAGAQKVVIVNGSTEILELLETVLDAGHYDVVFVESAAHAYSQVKRVQPNLVVLSLRMDDLDSFRVLSMLKLDP